MGNSNENKGTVKTDRMASNRNQRNKKPIS